MPELHHHPATFSTAVHGTIFAGRLDVVLRLEGGDELALIPDPPGDETPAVWVHAQGGDVVGHLPVQICVWLAPWMLAGRGVYAPASERRYGLVLWQKMHVLLHAGPA